MCIKQEASSIRKDQVCVAYTTMASHLKLKNIMQGQLQVINLDLFICWNLYQELFLQYICSRKFEAIQFSNQFHANKRNPCFSIKNRTGSVRENRTHVARGEQRCMILDIRN